MFKPFHTISMINPKRRSAGSHAKNMQESTLNAIVQSTNYTVTLEESGDDLVLPIPQELLTKLRWNTGDVLQWHVELDNTMTLRKLHGQ